MITGEYCATMARYNRWQNGKLYAACAGLDDAVRRTGRGAFFGSIHSTLNHLLYADLAFLSRFTGEPAEAPPLGVDLHDDFQDLRRERARIDRRLVDWAGTLSPVWLAQPMTYTSRVDGLTRTKPHWELVVHLFNHQTHHRGQLSTLLSQLGVDIGSTDLPFMPDADTAPMPLCG